MKSNKNITDYNFIDIHTHILNNLDDGSRYLNESMDLLIEAEEAGFKKVILTPHYYKGMFEEDKNTLINQYNILLEKLKTMNINLEIYLGNEIYISPNISEKIIDQQLLTLNNSKYVLVETSFDIEQLYLKYEMKKLIDAGYIPILAHPERYRFIQKDITKLDALIDMGVEIQCNYASIIGVYGKDSEKALKKMLKAKKVSYLSTDVHKAQTIYTYMPTIIKKLEKIVDSDYLEQITYSNALRIFS